jgi:NADPH:quinone reductase-like Zn-dependent oxidoreductase
VKTLLLASLAALGLSLSATDARAADSPLPTSTRKVVLQKTESGGYRWKLIESAPVPKPGDHQVLVHVRAVSLNRGDLEQLEPRGDDRDLSGLLVGSDAAGDVVAIGSKVKSVNPGARVTSTYFRDWRDGPPTREIMSGALGADVDGVAADYIVLEENGVVPIAAGLNYEQAATLPTAGLTAWNATVGSRPLKNGDVVLVQGTGGVSTFALQFAAAAGGRIIVTSSSDEKLRRVRDLGAKDGINYKTTPAWSARVLELTAGHGADLIVDVGGKDTLDESAKSVAYAGQVSLVGGLTGYDGLFRARTLIHKSARAQGIYVGSRADFLRMNAFIQTHRLRPVIDRVVPFEQYDEALTLMKDSNFIGKIVLRL